MKVFPSFACLVTCLSLTGCLFSPPTQQAAAVMQYDQNLTRDEILGFWSYWGKQEMATDDIIIMFAADGYGYLRTDPGEGNGSATTEEFTWAYSGGGVWISSWSQQVYRISSPDESGERILYGAHPTNLEDTNLPKFIRIPGV